MLVNTHNSKMSHVTHGLCFLPHLAIGCPGRCPSHETAHPACASLSLNSSKFEMPKADVFGIATTYSDEISHVKPGMAWYDLLRLLAGDI